MRILALLASCALLLPAQVLAQITVEDRLAADQPLVVIAHRAKGGHLPDNSLAGIQYAIDNGIDMVEVDVQMVREGDYILMHDPVLFTTTNVEEVFPNGAASREPGDPYARRHFATDYTLEEIAQLHLLDPEGGAHPVPTLDAALQLAEGKVLMILELKRWDIATLLPVFERHDTSNILLFNQSDYRKLRETADAAGIGVFATLERARDYTSELDKQIERFGPSLKLVDVPSARLSRDFLSYADAVDVLVGISGMDSEDFALSQGDEEPWVDALEWEPTAVMTGEPDALMTLIEE